MNCLRYLGCRNIEEAHEYTVFEYRLQMKAYALRQVDKERLLHLQAFKNQTVQATKKRGKDIVPVYETFNDFFDYEAEIDRILHPEKKEPEMKKQAKIINLAVMANSL